MGRAPDLTTQQRRLTALLGVLVLAAFTVAGLLKVEIDTSTASFLPSGDPAQEALEAKADDFGGDPVIVVLETKEERSLFNDPDALVRLVGLEGELAALPDVAAVYGPGTVLNQTAGAAQDMLAQISGRRDGYRQEVMATARAKGVAEDKVKALGEAAVQRFDERYGALMVQGLPAGLPTLKNPRFVQTVLFDEETLDARPQWRYLVPSPNSAAVLVRPRANLDADGTARLVDGVRKAVDGADLDLTRTTVTGAPAIAAGLADRGRSELPVLGAIAIGAVGLIFLLVGWTRRRWSRLRPTAAALVGTATTLACFGWAGQSVSLGVVAFLPILLGIGSDFPLYLSRGKWDRAVLVTAVAAMLGFGSLVLSPLPFVKELGVALAVGVGLTVAAALVIRWFLGPVAPPATASPARRAAAPSGAVRATAGVVLVVSATFGWIAMSGLDVEAQPDELAAGLPELEDAQHAEDLLGSSGEVSIVVRADDVTAPEVLAWSQQAQTRIVTELGDRVHPVLSVADLLGFLGDDPTPEQVAAAIEVMPRYLTSSVLRSDRSEGLVVLAVEFDDVAGLGDLLGELRTAIGAAPDGTEVDVVGLPVSAVRGLDLVDDGRLLINLAGIGLAGLAILIGLRSRDDALRAVLTVVVSTGWVALLAAATTGALNPLTIALGSLVTATGCEFSVMLRRGSELRTVATAALAGTTGYLVLALSELAVLRDFGLLLAGGVVCSFVAAMVVDRIILPAPREVPVVVPSLEDLEDTAPSVTLVKEVVS
ncbi:RND transporter [Nocardioides sp. Root190]|uniref:MMPL family transporter n=1 Tax=Nocardioides sp. Root190 TaxID=1736488 RepID=UPI0006FC2A2D|nr:MMPL family transporter [Nocardioides sp. Root190]KRB80385.1 RND transporter [Nocardioides sp. Root190]